MQLISHQIINMCYDFCKKTQIPQHSYININMHQYGLNCGCRSFVFYFTEKRGNHSSYVQNRNLYCNIVIFSIIKSIRLLFCFLNFDHYQSYSYNPVTSNLKLPFFKIITLFKTTSVA